MQSKYTKFSRASFSETCHVLWQVLETSGPPYFIRLISNTERRSQILPWKPCTNSITIDIDMTERHLSRVRGVTRTPFATGLWLKYIDIPQKVKLN